MYGFSILGEAMNDGVFPAFQAHWENETGRRVEFVSSFAGSGTITNQIVLGVPAEVAILSLELDALRLVDEGVLPGPTWQRFPDNGTVTSTPFIILARPGNPKTITGFDTLAGEGVGVVHPDPLTSGGAQWAILAEYGSALAMNGTPETAEAQLLGIWKNVVAQASSARAARTQFEAGFGDALVTYEQEAVHDLARGRLKAQIVYPPSTILSENLVVRIDRNVPPADAALVDAFLEYLWSDEAQRILVRYGFHSAIPGLDAENPAFGRIERLFTVEDLGGWPAAKRDIVEAVWMRRVLPEVS